jgi:hypothetical protein
MGAVAATAGIELSWLFFAQFQAETQLRRTLSDSQRFLDFARNDKQAFPPETEKGRERGDSNAQRPTLNAQLPRLLPEHGAIQNARGAACMGVAQIFQAAMWRMSVAAR